MCAAGSKRKRFLGPDHVPAQRLHGFAGMRQILAPLRLQIFERDPQQQIIDVVAAQMRVAVGREHFENPVVQFENRDVEGAAAQIVNGDDRLPCACRVRRPERPRWAH